MGGSCVETLPSGLSPNERVGGAQSRVTIFCLFLVVYMHVASTVGKPAFQLAHIYNYTGWDVTVEVTTI